MRVPTNITLMRGPANSVRENNAITKRRKPRVIGELIFLYSLRYMEMSRNINDRFIRVKVTLADHMKSIIAYPFKLIPHHNIYGVIVVYIDSR